MGHWKTMTFIAGFRQTGIVAPMVIKGAMNGEAFLAYIEQCLVPTTSSIPAASINEELE
jgi:H+/Cl- antiporter ClcA